MDRQSPDLSPPTAGATILRWAKSLAYAERQPQEKGSHHLARIPPLTLLCVGVATGLVGLVSVGVALALGDIWGGVVIGARPVLVAPTKALPMASYLRYHRRGLRWCAHTFDGVPAP